MKEALNDPKEIKIEEDAIVVEEEGFDVAEGEGNDGVKISVSVEKT